MPTTGGASIQTNGCHANDALRTSAHPTAISTSYGLWFVGSNLKGSEVERHIKVNSGSKSPYSVIFLARIACRYVTFELPDQYWVLAQALLVGYFVTLEEV